MDSAESQSESGEWQWQGMELDASRSKCVNIYGSYGVITETLNFLLKNEKTELHKLNRFFYDIAVCRV